VSALREWMAQIGRSRRVAVAFIGKVKTVAQMTALIALLLWEPVIPGVSTPWLGTIALWVAAILTLWSMFHYLRRAAPHFAADPLSEREEGPLRSRAKRKAAGKGKVPIKQPGPQAH
jgi:CDP-diacylglycerol--glycerol-3-phosphate 3-phosphatidyltransferase/cardiolipin synthase